MYGKWGEGKTSVLNFIKQELPDDCIVINFNPWLFSDQERLIRSFFNEIAVALDKSLTTSKENIGEILSEYGSLVGSIKVAGFGLQGINNIGDKWKDVTVEKLKQRVDNIIKESGKKLVICVDDIDRLDVKEIQYLFKLIKLVGDFSNTSYVLAFDDEMVASALAPIYGNGNKETGYQFLEKIIQVPLIIPKATRAALIKYTMALTDEVINMVNMKLTQDDMNNFRTVFDDNFMPVINNPRLSIRYANSLFFSLPLLSGEVLLTDLMLVEALKVFYPSAYDFMRMNSPMFITDNTGQRGISRFESPDKGTINNEINIALEKFNDKDKRRIMSVWQNLFPQYEYITTNRVYPDDSWREWYRDKRICSGNYFERYFTYTVIEGDLSDVFFDQFLKELNHLKFEEAKAKMEILFSQMAVRDVIFKLRLWEEELNSTQSSALSALIAEMGSRLPVESGEIMSFTTRAEGAKVIAQLIFNIEENIMMQMVIKTFDHTEDLEFAMEISYWMFYKEKKQNFKNLSENDVKQIHQYFVKRFQSNLSGDNFFCLVSDANLWRVLSWWKKQDADGLHDLTVEVLDNSPNNAIAMIKVFAPTITSWGTLEDQQIYKGGFTESSYNSMTEIVNPSLIYKILNDAGVYRLKSVALEIINENEKMKDEDYANVYIQFYEKKHLTLGDLSE